MSESKPLAESTGMTVTDTPHAPFVYFEEAPALGYINGLVRITLSAADTTLIGGVVTIKQVVTSYLRTNVQGARALRDALDAAILLSQPAENSDGKPS